MRRLSLTATLTAVFTLIALLTFYFVGGYLYTNLHVQLLRIDSEEVVIKAEHLRSLVAGEDSAEDLLTHISRFAGQVVGSNAFVVQILANDGRPLVNFNPSALPAVATPFIPDQLPVQDADVQQWKAASGVTARGVAVQARLHDGESVTIVGGRSIDDVLDILGSCRN